MRLRLNTMVRRPAQTLTAMVATAFGLVLGGSGPAWAQAEDELSELYQWTAPDIETQLEEDRTPIPAGRGAIFVPALSDPADEPEVVVRQGGETVADGPTGQRIVLRPGAYNVRVGSGSLQQTPRVTNVEVIEGETVVVPVIWGALRIEVVDENNVPHRGQYELIRVRDRELYGLGFGADTLQGESLRTWLLPPGVYRIIRPGDSYRARTNFSSVWVPEGGLVHFKLVLDRLSGEFLGAGVVLPSELRVAEGVSAWGRQLTLGVNAGLAHTNNVVGLADQLTLSGDLFLDGAVTFDEEPNFFAGVLELEEGFVQVRPAEGDPLPVQKSRDRLRLDLLYTYFLTERVGPYARAALVAGLFPTDVVVTQETTVIRTRLDGSQETELVPASDSFRVGGAFSPLQVREGVGFNFRLLRTNWGAVNLRVGAGFRQNFFNEAFVLADDASTPELEYVELENFNQEGLEGVLSANLRFSRWVTYTTETEYFGAFDDFDKPTVEWENTLSLRLASFVSIDYNVDLLYLPQVLDELQLSQNVLLRFSWDVL